MTDWKYFICVAILGLCCANGITSASTKNLLGSEQCTWGPSYWCSNITNAKGCGAVHHCIQTVWEKQTLPVDNDDICKICVDMVKQARDQLESNQTQEDLKAVFEGSCKLIPLQVIQDECIKLVDDFVVELIETLSSEMNPQVVCAVAGLCNNARIDKMLQDLKAASKPEKADLLDEPTMCRGCHLVANKMKQNFDALTYDEFLEKIIRQACGRLGSFSDSCSAIVFSHFEDIYYHMKNEFNADNVCHLTASCFMRYHNHEEDDTHVAVEIRPSGDSGKILAGSDDNLPCEFCEKLVSHLRDILIANTTNIEFKKVLEGICKQTGSFSQECLSLVDQYYLEVYNYLVGELDPQGVCFLAGICQKGISLETGPVAPLLPTELVIKSMKPLKHQEVIGMDERNSYQPKILDNVNKNQPRISVVVKEPAQLPIERLMVRLPENKALCTFCQYFLHYLQVEISDTDNEEKIKDVVETACKKLPESIKDECDSFVEAYGNNIIALLIQKLDPALLCPSLGLCPNDVMKQEEVKNVEILMTGAANDKPNCPLCLFAVQQLENTLENNNTKESIEKALKTLCSHVPLKLRNECTAFVDAYYKELVDMLVAEFTPQEVCVYLKLCKDDTPHVTATPNQIRIDTLHSNKRLMADRNNFKKPMLPNSMLATSKNGDIETNEIPDNTVNGVPVALVHQELSNIGSPGCLICEWVVAKLDKLLENNRTDEAIKHAVLNVCSVMPKNITKKCDDFINKYADLVIVLITKELSARQVCELCALCLPTVDLHESVLECYVCEEVVHEIEDELANPNVDHKIENIIEKACHVMPSKYYPRCVGLVRTYGESIINLLSTLPDSHSVCAKIGICGDSQGSRVEIVPPKPEHSHQLLGAKKCTWGPKYWCDNVGNAHECKALRHCQEKVWLGVVPQPKKN